MKYVVFGRVHPERADVNFQEITWRTSDEIRISARCEASQVSVVVEDSRVDGYVSAFIGAEHFANTIASCLGFALATSYSVELVQLLEDERVRVFGKRIEQLILPEWERSFLRATELARLDLYFRFAVADYTAALARPIDCGFLCNRAIESLKSSFGTAPGRSGWDGFHAALGTDEQEIRRKVKSFADPVRHGNWESLPATSGNERLAMLSLTKEILYKYLDLKMPQS